MKQNGLQFAFFRLLILMFIILSGSAACKPFDLLFTPDSQTPTPTLENCSWTWAYSDGSPEFEKAMSMKLGKLGVDAEIHTSTFGEVFSCDQSFAVMGLDVNLSIRVVSFENPESLKSIADYIYPMLQDTLYVSKAPNLGNVNLSFVDEDQHTCNWDFANNLCAE